MKLNKMKNFYHKLFFAILIPLFIQAQPIQKFGKIGNFKLENGQVIKDCIIGYHTCGKLNSNRSNVILFPTWFGGSSKDLLSLTGSRMMADSSKYFVITIDALGNGISSSPSNSKLQPNNSFPTFTIKDMVNSEYILVTKIFRLNHVFCVMGASMGGMQTFQWIVSYPDFMDRAVISVGSPKLTSNDLLLWNSELLAIKEGLNCNASEESIKNTVVAIHALNLETPDFFVEHVKPSEFPKYLKDTENQYTKVFNPYNWMSQLCAMIDQNISEPFNDNMQEAANIVKAKVLIIASKQDRMVNPHPAIDFAKLINAETLILNNNCGHMGTDCEMTKVGKAINKFLSE
jgi:homoserine O-acetyltransferase